MSVHPSFAWRSAAVRWPLLLSAALLSALPSAAKPFAPRTFCSIYSDAPTCSGNVPACMFCHVAPPDLNVFGLAVHDALPGEIEDTLPDALSLVENLDSDGDGSSNLEEILLGTRPGDPNSHTSIDAVPEGEPNPDYALGSWDPVYAYRRVSIAYCGAPPGFEALEEVRAATDEAAGRMLVHAKLSACLASDFWRNTGLMRLADKRIRPLQAVNIDGVIPLADYAWDYRLFVHALTGDRDARDLLLATYHIDPDGNVVNGVISPPEGFDIGGQPLEAERRAGMITTQWFLMIHTMFSELPRTTAAQAYRAYLGHDIAKNEGLLPVDGEPIDIDDRGVDGEACVLCHATLDPLSYAFAYYEGIQGAATGTYRVNRPSWSPDAVCKELGQYSCTGRVHLVALGGNDPFNKSQYEPLQQPMPTTPIAMDRVALAACTARVNADAAGAPVVFAGFDLSADRVDPSLDSFGNTADILAKRLLARALRPDELGILKDLATDDAGAPVPAHDVAVLMCFTMATLTETVLY